MPNIALVLKEEIRRLARKEARVQVAALKKAQSQQRREIAALKRQLQAQGRAGARLARTVTADRATPAADSDAAGPAPRFAPAWLRSHRGKLGLSAAKYADLVGVSGLTIYNWEKGKTRPRASQMEKLAAVRGLGKREVAKRLGGARKRGGRARKA